jgi:hypothetical protein
MMASPAWKRKRKSWLNIFCAHTRTEPSVTNACSSLGLIDGILSQSILTCQMLSAMVARELTQLQPRERPLYFNDAAERLQRVDDDARLRAAFRRVIDPW